MAFIGNPRNRCVTSDHIGVPSGGMFGDVRKWEPVLNGHGLRLGWSLIWHTFMVYTMTPAHGFVCQMHLKHRDGGPIPIDRRVVDTLVWARENFHREDQTLVKQMFDARQQRELDRQDVERRERAEASAEAAWDSVSLDLGLRTPTVLMEPFAGVKR